METNKKISIIVPVYNGEKYLENCFESLKNQTYKNLEIIFVNDCSSDNSLNMLNYFASIDNRVKIINNEKNSGVSATRNNGISNASGDYIGFCDCDDYCEKDMFASMLNAIEKDKSDICCCAVNRVHISKKPMVLFGNDCNLVLKNDEAVKFWLTEKYIANSIYTKLAKKELWNGLRFPEGEIFEESYVIPQLFLKANQISYINKPLYNYIERENSYTTSKFEEKNLVVIKRIHFLESFINENFPTACEEFKHFKLSNSISLYMKAIINKNNIDCESYKKVKHLFDSSFHYVFSDKFSDLQQKRIALELRTHFFHFRKLILKNNI